MRFTLWNLLTCITIIALTIALISSLRRSRSIVISEYDEFAVSGLFDSAGIAIWKSNWPDKTQPPPTPPQLVYSVARSVVNELEKSRERTRFGNWEIKELSLVPLEEREDEWLYLVCLRGVDYPAHFGINHMQSVRFMILMDGSVIPESSMYVHEIANATANHSEVKLVAPARTEPGISVNNDPNDPFSN